MKIPIYYIPPIRNKKSGGDPHSEMWDSDEYEIEEDEWFHFDDYGHSNEAPDPTRRIHDNYISQ